MTESPPSNVITIKRTPYLAPPEPPTVMGPFEAATNLLNDMVKMNNAGQMRACAIAVVHEDGSTSRQFALKFTTSAAALVGATELLKDYCLRNYADCCTHELKPLDPSPGAA